MSRQEAPRTFEMNILSAAEFMKKAAEGDWDPVSMQRNGQTGEYTVQLVKQSEATLTRVGNSGLIKQAPGLLVGYQVIEGLRLLLFSQIERVVLGSKLDRVQRTLDDVERFVARQDKSHKHFPKGSNNAVTSPILTI